MCFIKLTHLTLPAREQKTERYTGPEVWSPARGSAVNLALLPFIENREELATSDDFQHTRGPSTRYSPPVNGYYKDRGLKNEYQEQFKMKAGNRHCVHAKTLPITQKREGKLHGDTSSPVSSRRRGRSCTCARSLGQARTHWGGNFTFSSKSETACTL